MLDLGKPEAKYAITLAVLKPLPAGVVIECRFENPRGGSPMITEITDYTGKQELMIQSPAMNTLARKSYLFEAVVYADATKSKVVSSHKQPVFSSIPF